MKLRVSINLQQIAFFIYKFHDIKTFYSVFVNEV